MAKPRPISKTVARSHMQTIAKGETPKVEKAARANLKPKPKSAPLKIKKNDRDADD